MTSAIPARASMWPLIKRSLCANASPSAHRSRRRVGMADKSQRSPFVLLANTLQTSRTAPGHDQGSQDITRQHEGVLFGFSMKRQR
jgi:hypothetical protein